MSVLLNTFVKIVEKGMSRKMTKLVSDTYLFQIERVRTDSEDLQNDCGRLIE